ncbi:cytochrome P450 CYP72A219-like isoform X1 [Olea europaea var. sylvestris]|uniref:cytochrome P450 CYP72A219-like isoform X1 n=2 Tax=Olea europaea var. sylvestris TaxID=158386 RepID=UPI000C1CF5A9|nr:cytochrome P450 CYP72A219-like isoform X1 [Olea europaea var. sylvestris]
MNIATLIFFFLISVSLILGWRIANWLWFRPRKIEKYLRAQGFSGNPYRPIHGDSKEMAAMIKQANSKPINLSDDIIPRALPFHHHIINKYGKNSFSWIGPTPRVYMMEPELIKEVLTNNTTFKKPTPNPLAKFLICGFAGYEDEKWAKHRKMVDPAFYIEKLRHMIPAMHTSCIEMINKWEMLASEKITIEIDVQPYLEDLTCDVISRTAFGSSYAQGKMIFRLQKEQAELTRQVLQSVYIPGWRILPTKRNRRMKEINYQLCSFLKNIINGKLKAIKAGIDSAENDLLGILLKSNLEEIKKHGNNNLGMRIDEVIEECKAFYFAGQESTSNLLSWTMLLLSMHPSWQIRAREEIRQAFGNKVPDFDGLNRLKTVTMILYEVLRLYPPAIIFTRTINEETKLGEMTLPSGLQFLLPIILVHHDRQLWGEDVKEFKPERFSQGIAKATNNQLSFFPFSWGPRMCIGSNFSLMEAKIALVMILRRFSFELSPSYTHAPSFVVTLQPQKGVHIKLRKI